MHNGVCSRPCPRGLSLKTAHAHSSVILSPDIPIVSTPRSFASIITVSYHNSFLVCSAIFLVSMGLNVTHSLYGGMAWGIGPSIAFALWPINL